VSANWSKWSFHPRSKVGRQDYRNIVNIAVISPRG